MSETSSLIRGAEIFYDDVGSGAPVVWGHGLSQSRAAELSLGLLDWRRIPGRVVRYDARGHGASETTPDLAGYSWAEMALDQLALVDRLGIERYVAAGASMGCGTALHAAVSAPDRVGALVLVIPPTGWETRAAQASQWELTASLIETKGVQAVIEAREAISLPDPLVGHPTWSDDQAASTRAWDPARLAQVMRGAAGANLPEREVLAELDVPTLILAWSGDPIHPLSTSQELDRLLPSSTLHVASTRAGLDQWTDLASEFVAAHST